VAFDCTSQETGAHGHIVHGVQESSKPASKGAQNGSYCPGNERCAVVSQHSPMAFDTLSCPATSCEFERAFSSAKRLITPVFDGYSSLFLIPIPQLSARIVLGAVSLGPWYHVIHVISHSPWGRFRSKLELDMKSVHVASD
jgi:hypothetical protein